MTNLFLKFRTSRRSAITSILTLLGGGIFSAKADKLQHLNDIEGTVTDLCRISDDASFVDQLPLTNDELLRISKESELNLTKVIPTIPSPAPPSTINHLGWPVATMLNSGKVIMVYTRQEGHGGGDYSSNNNPTIFAGRYVTTTNDLMNWDPPHPWPNQAGKIGAVGNAPFYGSGAALHGIGVVTINNVERIIIVTSNREVYYSDDEGLNWNLNSSALLGMLDGAKQIGPNLINHPDFGLLGVFSQEGPSINNDRNNYVIRTQDGGLTWESRVWKNSKMARSVEPAIATWGEGHMIMIAREYYAPFANPDGRFYHYTQHVYRHRHEGCYFQELEFSTARTNIRGNGILGQSCHDTAEVIYNPVSKRIEVIQSHRLGGGLGNTGNSAWVGTENINASFFEGNNVPLSRDQEPIYTLNIWSISPDQLLESSADWRFDGTLLASRGYSVDACRDGLHPGGSIIDLENNQHHIFIYSGAKAGPTSIYRISRTLDTDLWRGVGSPESLNPSCGPVRVNDLQSINSKIEVRGFPNPAQEFIEIQFKVLETFNFKVQIDVINLLGQHIKRLDNNYYAVGTHQVTWNISRTLPNGIYTIRFRVAEESIALKVQVIR